MKDLFKKLNDRTIYIMLILSSSGGAISLGGGTSKDILVLFISIMSIYPIFLFFFYEKDLKEDRYIKDLHKFIKVLFFNSSALFVISSLSKYFLEDTFLVIPLAGLLCLEVIRRMDFEKINKS